MKVFIPEIIQKMQTWLNNVIC